MTGPLRILTEDDIDPDYVPADLDPFLNGTAQGDDVPPGADDWTPGDRPMLPTVEPVEQLDDDDEDGALVLGAAALHGLPGEVVGITDPITEADPAAVLVSFLAGVGNIIGPSPHVWVGNTEHPARIFPLIVGATSKARKGTSWAAVRPFLWEADHRWAETRIMDGFGSGEVLIDAVADPETDDEETPPEPTDKRLFVMTPEFARLVKVASRDHSTLSANVREAWDDGRLQTRSRGHGAIVATGAHISILGHITATELRRVLSETETVNGFANRFLFVAASRSKRLPFGDEHPVDAVRDVGRQVRQARAAATLKRRYGFTDEARPVWADLYNRLGDDEPGGLLGAVTARSEPQVIRLALIYAVLDRADAIGVDHLEAAAAVWSYCRASARQIFGDAIGDEIADRILVAIRRSGDAGMSLMDIRNTARSASTARRDGILNDLEDAGKIRHEEIPTAGRPERRYYATAISQKGRKS